MSDEKKFMTVDEMIAELQKLSADGFGDYEVACSEYMAYKGAPTIYQSIKLVEFTGKA